MAAAVAKWLYNAKTTGKISRLSSICKENSNNNLNYIIFCYFLKEFYIIS
jgi:hypothetical protein